MTNATATTMRAAVHREYGGPDVLHVEQVPAPTPNADEVLVRVHAATVNRTDCGFRRADPALTRLFSGLRRPKQPILGTELAGVVEAVGSEVSTFEVGQRVFGVNADRFGANAELVCVAEDGPLAVMPDGMGFDEAASVCDGVVLAHTCLRWAKVQEGQRVLVYGASGSIGTAGVQLAKHLGAHVTAVCDPEKVEIVRSLGVDEVVDRSLEDFTTRGETYDVVFDAVGKIGFGAARKVLVRGGTFASTDFGPKGQVPFLALLTRVTRLFGTRRVLMPLPRYRKEQVLLAKELIEAGEYQAVVDRTYPLEDVVEATRYVETEQKTGNVVLVVTADSTPSP